MAAAPETRDAAWFFLPQKQLKKLADKIILFDDTSLISAFVDDRPQPQKHQVWTVSQGRAAAKLIQEADATDERLQDGVEFRFFVGGVSCKGTEAYEKLIAAAATVSAFKTALLSHPQEHGVAPWVTLLTECEARRGGITKGPSGAIVGASRDESFNAAGQAAVAVFKAAGPHGLTIDECMTLKKLCLQAGVKCPLDLKKINAVLAAKHCEDAMHTARNLGAGTDDTSRLANALATFEVWKPFVNEEYDPQLNDEINSDIINMIEVYNAHQPTELTAARKAAQLKRTA